MTVNVLARLTVLLTLATLTLARMVGCLIWRHRRLQMQQPWRSNQATAFDSLLCAARPPGSTSSSRPPASKGRQDSSRHMRLAAQLSAELSTSAGGSQCSVVCLSGEEQLGPPQQLAPHRHTSPPSPVPEGDALPPPDSDECTRLPGAEGRWQLAGACSSWGLPTQSVRLGPEQLEVSARPPSFTT